MNVENEYKFFDNALVFFVYNKVNCMRELDICKTYYDVNEIEVAKKLIFEVYDKTNECMLRKGANKTINDLQDIVKLIRTNSPLGNTKFCVTSYNRLPHVDAASLVKQVTELLLEFLKLSSIQEEVSQLKLDISKR